MKVLHKKNNELNDGEIESLFALHLNSVISYSNTYGNLKTSEYKDKWKRYVKETENLICTAAILNGYLIGFSLMVLDDDENYISDFYIDQKHQNDGQTFRFLIENTFKVANPNKIFSGRIWSENKDAQNTFLKIGATFKEGKYYATYEKIKEWVLNK